MIAGTGVVRASQGGGGGGGTSAGSPGGSGGAGRIRLEAFDTAFSGSLVDGVSGERVVTLSPNAVFLPTDTLNPVGTIRATFVAGVPVPLQPTGSFLIPDVTINTDAMGNPLTLTGTQQMSATMCDVTFSPGFSWVFVTATWTP